MKELEYSMMLVHNLVTLIGTEDVDPAAKVQANELLVRLMTVIVKPNINDFLAAKSGIVLQ